MYYQAIKQCISAVKNIEVLFVEAESFARVKGIDIQVLMDLRLAPDMKPLGYQILGACNYLKAGAARLSGQKPPVHEDMEVTITDLRARIAKTVAFAESVTEEQYADAENLKIPFYGTEELLTAKNYLRQLVIPNLYFHVSMIYAILRSNGVDIGKLHFLGPIDTIGNTSRYPD